MGTEERRGYFLLEALLSLLLLLLVSSVALFVIQSYSKNRTFLTKKELAYSCINSLAYRIQAQKCVVDESSYPCGEFVLTVEVSQDTKPYKVLIKALREGKVVEDETFYCSP